MANCDIDHALRNKEQFINPRTRQLLDEGFDRGFANIADARALQQVAPSAIVELHKVQPSLERPLLVKVFNAQPEAAAREHAVHTVLEQRFSFVPQMAHHKPSPDTGRTLLAYEFIDGPDLYDIFTQARAEGHYPSADVIQQGMLQMLQISAYLGESGFKKCK